MDETTQYFLWNGQGLESFDGWDRMGGAGSLVPSRAFHSGEHEACHSPEAAGIESAGMS